MDDAEQVSLLLVQTASDESLDARLRAILCCGAVPRRSGQEPLAPFVTLELPWRLRERLLARVACRREVQLGFGVMPFALSAP